MAKDTNRRIEANFRNPRFKKLLEEARLMVQQGKNADAAYHVLGHMNLEKHENNPDLLSHIPDRQLAEMLGIPNPNGGGKTTVWNERQRLIRERWGIEIINTPERKVIGSGWEFVYVIYLPLYRKHAESQGETTWECKVGSTADDVEVRMNKMTFPERPRMTLVIRTDDCKTLEDKIHDRLKEQGKHIPDAHGKEWFLTNPAEVEGIVKSIHSMKNSNE